MKISSELRQEILDYIKMWQDDNPDYYDNKGIAIREALTYKKRGRKVGWRKYKVLKPE